MKTHALCEMWPEMSADEFAALTEDIRANGLREPIWTYRGEILDGRHRYRACVATGITPTTREYEGDSPSAFVVSMNLHRRHLDTSQRAMVAARMATRTKGRPSKDNGQICPLTQPEAAASLNVSTRAVKQAAAVIEHGTPGLIDAVTQGQVSVSAAEKIARPHVAQNSGNNEWYTPREFTDAAREVMGGIDLDPASCEAANASVGAKRFFSADDDGLAQKWGGRVWMNPPYAQPLVTQFCEKLAAHVQAKEVKQAVVLVNNATETQWFGSLARVASAMCFPTGRVRFWSPARESAAPLQGQAVVYVGAKRDEFVRVFRPFGLVVLTA